MTMSSKNTHGPTLNHDIVLLPETNVCTIYRDAKDKRNRAVASFFDNDPRYLIMGNVMKEYENVAKQKHLNPVLDPKHKQCTDNVSNAESNQRMFTSEMQDVWVEKVERMYESINNYDGLAQQRRRWNMVKHTRDPEYPYSISMSKKDATRDIQILARAAFLANLAKYQIVLFTFDADFITFSNYIRKKLDVHILSAFWYFDHKSEYDPADAVVRMSDPDLLDQYTVLDKHGKARLPNKMKEQGVVVPKDDRGNIQSKQPSNAAPDMTGNPITPRIGEEFTEKQLYKRFSVRNSGGIRPSIKNKVVILIDSYSDQMGGYDDRVDKKNGIVYYVGEGNGDQEMTRGNKSIRDAKNRGFKLLYFEKQRRDHLVYRYTLEYVSQ